MYSRYLYAVLNPLPAVLLILFIGGCSSKPKSAPLKSPFPSTVKEIPIRNTHLVAKDKGVILRGMAPLVQSDVTALADYGVNEVMIFRNDVPGETGISSEISLLRSEPRIRTIHMIPFKWKEITDFRLACMDTIKGLQILQSALKTQNAGLFFHCTVGEDRTGYLSGLRQIIFENQNPQSVFQNEMCAKGYAHGNSQKPEFVSKLVHENITLLFVKMLVLIEEKKLSAQKLDLTICESDPVLDSKMKSKIEQLHNNYLCK